MGINTPGYFNRNRGGAYAQGGIGAGQANDIYTASLGNTGTGHGYTTMSPQGSPQPQPMNFGFGGSMNFGTAPQGPQMVKGQGHRFTNVAAQNQGGLVAGGFPNYQTSVTPKGVYDQATMNRQKAYVGDQLRAANGQRGSNAQTQQMGMSANIGPGSGMSASLAHGADLFARKAAAEGAMNVENQMLDRNAQREDSLLGMQIGQSSDMQHMLMQQDLAKQQQDMQRQQMAMGLMGNLMGRAFG